jgi:hypothetical protein
MRRRHITTAITLLVLVGILVLGVVLGVNALFAPLPDNEPSAEPSPTCTVTSVKKGQRIAPAQVQISVFDGGTRGGLAGSTMQTLARRGFKQGEVGNAPTNVRVRRVQIWTTQRNDDAARLVALQFGRTTRIRVTTIDLGPGIDVVVGDNFHRLDKVKRFVIVRRSSSVCVPLPGATTDAG